MQKAEGIVSDPELAWVCFDEDTSRMKTYLNFIQAPSTIPKWEPVVLIHGDQQIVFNAILENEKGFDLLIECEPWSYVINDIPLSALSKSANEFISGRVINEN